MCGAVDVATSLARWVLAAGLHDKAEGPPEACGSQRRARHSRCGVMHTQKGRLAPHLARQSR